jgi:bifunctional DNA-binding transcriptional regulator/antitoxin component of YhaV-PrlF toxin-antitoxin module
VYRRELIDVGAPTKAFVYYPDGADPANYTPLSRGGKSVSVIPQVALPAPAVDDDDDAEGDGRRVDARGSLTVPSHLIIARGLNSGDRVFVQPDNGGLRITQKDDGNATTSYVVDKNHNVRITQSHLTASGFAVTDTFDFNDSGDDILVAKHIG